MNDLKYFKYLKNRSYVSLLLRRLFFLENIKKEFDNIGKVLDVGCGIGEFLSSYKNKLCIGIDINPYCVKFCRENGLDVRKASTYKLPFMDEEFDGVLCSHILEHLDKPIKAFQEMNRVLKHEGKIIIVVPCGEGFKSDVNHVKFWDSSNMEHALRFNGFIPIKRFCQPINNFSLFFGMLKFQEMVVVGVKK